MPTRDKILKGEYISLLYREVEKKDKNLKIFMKIQS